MNGSHASPAVDLAPATAVSSTAVLDWEPEIGKGLVTQVVLSGDAYQIGLQHGRQEREAIHAILERQISRYGSRLDNMPELDQALMDPGRYFGEEEVAELKGIADGAELPVGFLVGHNLGLCEDYVPGCVHFAITSGVNGRHGLIHAANEDSSLALSLTDSLKRIVQYRAPAKGYRHVAFSVTGQLCGINGTNEKGLTVSSTLLLDRAPRDVTAPGDIHPVLIKRILENAATPEEAVEILKESKRNGAWGICISHSATDSLSYVEYDSDQIEVRTGMTRVVGTNHSLLLGATHPTPPHSIHRMERLNELLNSHEADGVTSQIAEASLRDQFDGRRQRVTAHPTMNTICRVDNQISVVMSPAQQVIRVTPGPAKKEIAHEFSTLTIEEFFRTGSKKNDTAGSSSVDEGNRVDSARVTPKTDRFDGLPAAADRVMRRVVLRPRQESLPNPGTAALPLTGRSLVYGTGEVAETLVARLRESGLSAELLNVCDDVAALEADFEKLTASQPVDHLFVVGPKTLEEVAAGNASDRFVSTFRVCQLWTQWAAKCGKLATSTMTAITFMGGNFGLNGSPTGADGGALTGLWKALRRELGVVPARVIDFSGDESAARVVEQLQNELAHPFQTCEVAYSRGERFVLSARPVPSSPKNDFGPTPGTAWIVTGGARGVTAVVARELGLRCGVHLHLIGSSPLAQVDPALMDATAEELKPLRRQLMSEARERGEVPLDAWNAFERGLEINRTLREMAQAGVSVTYHACDVSDAAAVQKTISAIRSLNVPIEGVIHGAGVENACRFDRKQLPKVRKTFDVKVDGAKSLAMALEHDPVVFFVGFGSTSGRFGGLGQADYSAASDSLAKFCNELGRKRPDCRTITVHWPPWGEVGMAARPESKLALEAGGMAFMPPREGVAFLLEELCSAAPEPEILLVDKPDGLDLDKTLPARAEWDDYADAQSRVESSPLLETVVEFERDRSVKVEARFNPATDPFLYDHQHKNAPILPMAFGMETLAQTLKVLVPELTSLTISNTEIVNGMRFFADRPEVVTARVEKVGDHYVGELVSKFLNRKGVLLQNERVLVKAELRPATAAGLRVMPVPSTAASETVEYAETWEQIGEPSFGSVFTGPTIRGVTEISRESDSFKATIVPPSTAGFAGSRPATGWLTSPAVLDACFIGCDRWTSLTLGRLHLPQTFDEVQFHQVVPDGQPCRLFGQVLEVGDNQIRYDFSLWNASGQALIEARGFQVVSASTSQVVSTPPQTSPAPVEKVETPVATQTVSQESAAPQLLFPLEAITSSADLWEVEVRIEPLTEPLLNGHRFNNSPLLPGVAMVELFTEALREVCPGHEAPRVRNFQIHHSLHLKAALPRRVQVVAQRSSDGFDCRLVDLDGGNILLATAKIDRIPFSPESLPKLDKPKGQFGPMKYPDAGPLIHGAPLRSLHALCSGRDDAWAEILPTEISTLLGKGSTCQPVLHPAVLDASFFACGVHAWINCYGRVELPLGFEELLVLRNEPLRKGEKLMARIRYRDSDDTGSTYDLSLFDTNKQPVYIIKGYRSVAKGSVSL
ncbi:MAG: hypothetical protein C0478_09355 [Planctomyces sp.]|nr:hypothetical protein [Planctomyces sp.]